MLDRRAFLKIARRRPAGALHFRRGGCAGIGKAWRGQRTTAKRGGLADIAPDGKITAFTGKVEVGQNHPDVAYPSGG